MDAQSYFDDLSVSDQFVEIRPRSGLPPLFATVPFVSATICSPARFISARRGASAFQQLREQLAAKPLLPNFPQKQFLNLFIFAQFRHKIEG